MPTEDQIKQPLRTTKLQLPIEIIRLSSRQHSVHLAAYPEAVEVLTKGRPSILASRVARYVLRPTNTKDIPRNPTAFLEKITSQ
jgi:hypothetical protein